MEITHSETMIKTVSLHIKNMVCDRCIRVVREELTKTGLAVHHVELGRAEVSGDVSSATIRSVLARNGFELLEDKNAKLVENIKSVLIGLIQNGGLEEFKGRLSDYLARSVGKDYASLSRLFSSVEGITIEKYTILQKIEKAKEWLVYDDDSLSEISYKLGYSSVAHLSKQFKLVTGLTPSEFKSLAHNGRRSLDRVKD